MPLSCEAEITIQVYRIDHPTVGLSDTNGGRLVRPLALGQAADNAATVNLHFLHMLTSHVASREQTAGKKSS